jgi:hypothetical protein
VSAPVDVNVLVNVVVEDAAVWAYVANWRFNPAAPAAFNSPVKTVSPSTAAVAEAVKPMYAPGTFPCSTCHGPAAGVVAAAAFTLAGRAAVEYHRSTVRTEDAAEVFDWMIPKTVDVATTCPTTAFAGMFTPSVVNVVAVGAVVDVPAYPLEKFKRAADSMSRPIATRVIAWYLPYRTPDRCYSR